MLNNMTIEWKLNSKTISIVMIMSLFMCLIFVIITSCLTSTKAKLNLYVNKDEVQTLLGMFSMFYNLFIIVYYYLF
jgi:hypothetical protein